MQPITYWAFFAPQPEGGYVVTFPDVPEAITQGETEADAQAAARDALNVALEGYLRRGLRPQAATRWPTGTPTVRRGHKAYEAPVEPALAARLLLVAAMQDERLSKVALAQRLGRDEKVVRRILDGSASFAQVMDALRAVGVRPALAA